MLIATGLHRCGPVHQVSGNLEAEVLRQEVLTEMVNGVGATFLGLTFACTRCHDHKFDPLSAGDYYRLQAFFANAKYTDVDFATQAERDARKKRLDDITAKTAPLKKQIAELDSPVRAKLAKAKREALEPKYRDALDTPADKRTAEQKTLAAHANTLAKVSWDEVLAAMPPDDLVKRAKLREQLHALEAQIPPPTSAAWAIENSGSAKTFVLKRGEAKQKTLEVQPGFPRVLVSGEAPAPKSRRELADWLTSADHPLTARVIVNRLWQHHFGERHCRHAQRLRSPWRIAFAPRTARLAGVRTRRAVGEAAPLQWGGLGGFSLVVEAHSQVDRYIQHLSTGCDR